MSSTEREHDRFWLANSGGTTPASTPLLDEFVDTLPPGHYLDVGTGFGRGAFLLASKGHDVTGVDMNEEEIEEAKRRNTILEHEATERGTTRGTVIFQRARGDELPFGDNTFDGAVMLGLHGAITGADAQTTRRKVLSEATRTIKPGKPVYVAEFAVVTDPAAVDFYGKPWKDVYRDEERLTDERHSFTVRQPDGSTHFIAHHFTGEELRGNMSSAGLGGFQTREFMGRSALSGNPSPQIVVWGRKQ